MPSSDYTNVVSGGLKLKGVDKKKKKKPKPPKPSSAEPQQEEEEGDASKQSTALQKALAEEEGHNDKKVDAAEVSGLAKTEAQRRFEERRKKRLDERLKKEGVPTHKERVQQLNKYLSTLSEHNDMPRIGPG